MPTSSTRQASVNLDIYESQKTVADYVGYEATLFIGEQRILDSIAEDIRGTPILDIGVGGGRTTPAMLELSDDYLGVDYSTSMISACRQKYHGVRYSVCDARDMSSLDKGKFGFVFFSFNGIDCVNHEERQSIIHQIQKLLRPGGYFLFSSHNLKSPPQKPWEKGLYLWSKKPGVLFQSIGEYIRNCFNYSKNVRAQFYGDGYAILIDLDENFKVLYYYTDPLSEVRRLKNHGFEEIITYTRWGLEQDPDSSKLARTPHVNFLARKPAL